MKLSQRKFSLENPRELREIEMVTYCEIETSLRLRRSEIKPSHKLDFEQLLELSGFHLFLCKMGPILEFSLHLPYGLIIAFLGIISDK